MKSSLLYFFSFISISFSYEWKILNNHLTLNNIPTKIKGINWYGFETSEKVLEGLWQNNLDFYLQQLSDNHFNAIRLPISVQMVLYDNHIVPSHLISKEPNLFNKTSIQILDHFMALTKSYNILVLIDFHRLQYSISSPLWYLPLNSNYSNNTLLSAIQSIIDRYHHLPNFLGIDLFNEPHYQSNYGSNNISSDWRLFIQNSAHFIFSQYPQSTFLLFVNGIDWGKNLSQYAYNPPNLSSDFLQRIVLSPHIYGPSISYISSYDPNYLYSLWDSLFGYIFNFHQYHICIGEWGGQFDHPDDFLWLKIFSQYLIHFNFTNNFFWALNPYSKDVSGLLDDWNTFNSTKLDFINNIQPYPSFFFFLDQDIIIL